MRLPNELKDKVKQRAALNGRSLNAELVQIVRDALAQPSPVSGYRNDAEQIADQQAEVGGAHQFGRGKPTACPSVCSSAVIH
ncbi:Arc-like DNA binding domain protein [compost metagenome]